MSTPTTTPPVVTGYPAPPTYPYPPPPPPPNSYYYQNQYYSDANSVRHTTFLRRILTVIITTIILFITITLIAYLILKPQLPIFHITSATISNLTITNTSLISFTSQIHLTSRNPNRKMNLEYDQVQAGLFYKWYTISETNVEPFEQGRENESDLVASFASFGRFVDRDVVDGIGKERERERNGGVVQFGIRLVSNVGFEAKAWSTRRFVRVFCPLDVEFQGSEGRLSGGTNGSRQCRVVI